MNQTRSTKDIGAASFLQTIGFPVEVRKTGNRGVFYFSAALQKNVELYYAGEGKFKDFAANLRNLKSQIENAPEEGSSV